MATAEALERGDVGPAMAATRSWGRPSKKLGALIGALTVLAFAAVHDIFIVDIWDNIRPMLIAGTVSGICLVWSYNKAVAKHSTLRWLGYNGSYAALLIGLGIVSLVVLEPQFTMAELMLSDDALAQVIPPAVPLMIVACAVGTLLLWSLLGRKGSAFIPLLVTQVLLVLLVGHNLAILGVVEMSASLLYVAAEFVVLTVVLAAGFATGVVLTGVVRSRVAAYV